MRPADVCLGRWRSQITLLVAAVLVLAGCGSHPATLRMEARPLAILEAPAEPAPSPGSLIAAVSPTAEPVGPPVVAVDVASSALFGDAEPRLRLAQAPTSPGADPAEIEQYDPWESFNEKMFDFNLKLDKYVLKPVANVYRHVMPEPFQILVSNGFDNIRWPARFINSLLQGKFGGAGREVARFLINSTAGIGGLFDPAKDYWGIRASKEDFGQTLAVWGSGPGPYLILPFLPPMTVRDGIGLGVDSLLDPLSWYIPFFWDRLGMRIGDTINERSLNYDLFEGVEETTIDLYSSVRHFYLQRRDRLIKE